MNPFRPLSLLEAARRLAAPALALLLVLFPMIGILAQTPSLEEIESEPSPLVPARLVRAEGLYGASFSQIGNTRAHWREMPETCRAGGPQSEFLQQECAKVRRRAWLATGICLAPLLGWGMALVGALDLVRAFHRRARRKIEREKGVWIGTVTKPALLPTGWFAWQFCLVRVSVVGPDQQQVAVHLPWDAPVPQPGQKMVVYESGLWLGSVRRVGVLYAPHMAIVSG